MVITNILHPITHKASNQNTIILQTKQVKKLALLTAS